MGNKYNTMARLDYMDALKGFGILLMVMGHVGFGDTFNKCIHGFHMPLFFFVSGFFYRTEKRSVLQNLKHNLKTLILPYTLFVIICQPLHYWYTKEWSFSYFVLSYFTSNHNRVDVAGAYWFLLCLFTAKTLFDIIMKKSDGRIRTLIIIAITIFGNLRLLKLPICLDSAMSVLVFMFFGWLIRKYVKLEKWKTDSSKTLLIFTGLFFLGVTLILVCPEVNIRTNSLGLYPVSWVNASICIVSLMILFNLGFGSKNRLIYQLMTLLKYFGKSSIVFLLFNEICIYCSNMVVNKLGYSTGDMGIKLIETFAVMGLLCIISKVVYSTFLHKLIGQ